MSEANGNVSDAVGEGLRRIRKLTGMSVNDLAGLCAEVGAPELTANAIYLIEGGRRKGGRRTRQVTVDELLALSAALGIPPVDLLVPATLSADDPVNVTPTTATTAARARDWIGGQAFLEEPENVAQLARVLPLMSKERGEARSREWFSPERMAELNRQTNAWQAANEPQDENLLDRMAGLMADAASVSADPQAVISGMVANLQALLEGHEPDTGKTE